MNIIKIKVKETKDKTIKTLNKSVAWTERIKDPLMDIKNLNNKNEENNPVNYGTDIMNSANNRVIDETIYASTNTINSGKELAKDKLLNKKTTNKNVIKNNKSKIKSSVNRNKKVTEKGTNTAKRIYEQGKKLAIQGTKKVVKGIKISITAIISSIKAIIAGAKSLVTMISAGGVVAAIAIVIICLVGLLVTSVFGIFFSSEDTGNNIKMNDCIAELNNSMELKINNIKNATLHDEVIIVSNKAEWKDILAIYSVKLSNGDNTQDVMIVTEEKKKILNDIFWKFNNITYEVKSEEYENTSIGTLEQPQFYPNTNYQRPVLPNNSDSSNEDEKTTKKVLYIYINSKSVDEIINIYNFNEKQKNQYNELSSEKYLSLWSSAIYGVYGSNGNITDWKQKGKEWSNIKIGSTSATIGDIGCLVTSVAILIEKSGVPTGNIYPFNPGTFVIALNDNYGFDDGGNLQYYAIEDVVPKFKYVGKVNLREKTKSERLAEIKKYHEDGYYISVEVKGATKNNQHWVALDNIINGRLIMLDPGSNSTDVWEKYDWNNTSQFVYFKVER